MGNGKYDSIKERCYSANLDIPRYGLAVFTFGNASAFDKSLGVFAIKPSGVPYDQLSPDNMVVVDLEYKVVEGSLRPSSDTKTHAVLYRAFGDIGGIVHTHSTYATAWAQAMTPIPIFGTTHADHLTEPIPCTDVMDDEMIKGDYEEETGNQILKTFDKRSHKEAQMVLVACHGVFTWGLSPEQAVYNAVVTEELAKMALLTILVNPEVPQIKKTLIQKHFQRKYGKNAYYGQK